MDPLGYPEGLWEVTKNSHHWFPRVPTSARKALGVNIWKVTSCFCASICLSNPKIAHGNQFSMEKLKIHFVMSGWSTPALAGAISSSLAALGGFGGLVPTLTSFSSFRESFAWSRVRCSALGTPGGPHSRKKQKSDPWPFKI